MIQECEIEENSPNLIDSYNSAIIDNPNQVKSVKKEEIKRINKTQPNSKPPHSHICKKFEKDPHKFFTKPPSNRYLSSVLQVHKVSKSRSFTGISRQMNSSIDKIEKESAKILEGKSDFNLIDI